jgi:hypothetical protein
MSSSTSVVVAVGPASSTLKGPTIDVFFNFGGDCCRTHQQHPPRGPSSTSSQLQWWLLPDPPTAPPKGPAFDVFCNFSGGHCRTRWQQPQGAHHRCFLQLRWCPLSDPPTAPLKTSSSTLVVAAAGLVSNTRKGPAIDVLQQVVAVARFF